MTGFRVWAPRAGRMTLELDGARIPMTAGTGGWWSAEGEGRDYGFLIDDAAPPRPDPRSRRQPNGVHGLSRVEPTIEPLPAVPRAGGWTGRQLAGGIVYELHIGTFTPEGTFEAAIARLDHLVHLGVDFVEVLPVNAFNGEWNWGYDGVLWYAVQESYGGPAGYRHFVDACHERGLAVIQDVVYNHLGPSGNYLPEFGPYLHEGRANTWGASMNLDGPDSDEVRAFIIDNALMWLGEYGVDGLRLDAVHALVDHRAVHLLEELAERVDALSAHVGRPLTLIAESDLNDPRLIRSREANGYGLDAQWSDDFHHAVHVAVSGETVGYYADFAPLSALADVLEGGFFHARTRSTFRGRIHGRPIDTERTPTWRLVVFDQDHDQIGNRAVGDRLSASVDDGGLRIAAALTLLSPFTPMLFMGEEWAATTPWQFFTSHPEPELGKATAEGRIAEFERMGWDPAVVPDPQDPETFRRSKLDWSEPYPAGEDGTAHSRMLAWYRELIALRKARPELTDPSFAATEVEVDEAARTLLVHRGRLAIAVNLSDAGATVALDGAVLADSTRAADGRSSRTVLGSAELPPRSILVVEAPSVE
ncbi:malto-oligosyltrehalose trehalohydrolase [Agromyces seonyuensis]|uniref:Malto-oligosyltrehalose trehalohydrolase n=1 Tax=Agromyces seonyuensis TaxID=2662446 RepID=A0A6I4P3Y5_9MICO|nr:malto-oligosyltrehalose trehalohydrolase [Agromyces seonyuensis]MWB98087.1 malto-oligosyltrehalose trehalohydrolase [Agromyces seonyuensis]